MLYEFAERICEATGEELAAAPTPCFPVPLGRGGRQLVIELGQRIGRRVFADCGLLLISLL